MQAARGASLNARDTESGSSAAIDPAEALPPRRVVSVAVIAVVTFLLDLGTKVAAVERLTGREPVEVVPGVLQLTLVRNPGAAFGLAAGLTLLLTCVAAVVVVVLLRMAGRLRDRGWAIAFGLLLGGAVGNLIDRLFRQPGPFRGHVVDFLQLPNWPVFNVADAAICVAAAVVVFRSLRGVGLDGRHE